MKFILSTSSATCAVYLRTQICSTTCVSFIKCLSSPQPSTWITSSVTTFVPTPPSIPTRSSPKDQARLRISRNPTTVNKKRRQKRTFDTPHTHLHRFMRVNVTSFLVCFGCFGSSFVRDSTLQLPTTHSLFIGGQRMLSTFYP
eukprot:m.82321 g.82321  ORF g.82321 m.82321 type:complete len:143 (-) comp25508_c0_seq2:48-476(-)